MTEQKFYVGELVDVVLGKGIGKVGRGKIVAAKWESSAGRVLNANINHIVKYKQVGWVYVVNGIGIPAHLLKNLTNITEVWLLEECLRHPPKDTPISWDDCIFKPTRIGEEDEKTAIPETVSSGSIRIQLARFNEELTRERIRRIDWTRFQ